MALRPTGRRQRAEDVPSVLVALARAEPVLVTDLDEFGAPCLRVVLDRVRDLPEAEAARRWAEGDRVRADRVRLLAARLCSLSYAASTDAVERSRIPSGDTATPLTSSPPRDRALRW